MPRQWKLIALYMLLAYLVFVAEYKYAKHRADMPDFEVRQMQDR